MFFHKNKSSTKPTDWIYIQDFNREKRWLSNKYNPTLFAAFARNLVVLPSELLKGFYTPCLQSWIFLQLSHFPAPGFSFPARRIRKQLPLLFVLLENLKNWINNVLRNLASLHTSSSSKRNGSGKIWNLAKIYENVKST